MALFMIGIGLSDEKDITVKGLELVKKSDFVYLENYTSLLSIGKEKLEEFYGKKVILADRKLVEQKDEIVLNAKDKNVSFLVIGDVFGATTHYDLYTRAKKEKINVEVVYNASILNAVGVTGLMLYNFGKTTSIPFPKENYKPESAYDAIRHNKESGLHTLVLLDVKPDEEGFMTVSQGLKILLNIEDKRKEEVITEESLVLGCARIGGEHRIRYGKIKELLDFDFGQQPHCIIVPGNLHFVEEEALEEWK